MLAFANVSQIYWEDWGLSQSPASKGGQRWMLLCQAFKSQRTLWNEMGGPWFPSEAICWTFLLILVGRYREKKQTWETRQLENNFQANWKVIKKKKKKPQTSFLNFFLPQFCNDLEMTSATQYGGCTSGTLLCSIITSLCLKYVFQGKRKEKSI